MPRSHLLNTTQWQQSQHEVGGVRVSGKMVEAKIFDDPKMNEVITELREKYGGQGKEFWDAWYAGADNELLDPVGAERSTDTADRADRQIEALLRYGNFHTQKTGRSLEVILITHHEVLQPYALHKLGVSQEDFVPGKNEGFVIKADSEETTVEIAGERMKRRPRPRTTTKRLGEVGLK